MLHFIWCSRCFVLGTDVYEQVHWRMHLSGRDTNNLADILWYIKERAEQLRGTTAQRTGARNTVAVTVSMVSVR